jgi:predicted PurR-regulated permease PerM
MSQPHVSSHPPHAGTPSRPVGGDTSAADAEPRLRIDRPATWLMVLVALVLIYFVGRVLLLTFAGVLLAILLNAAAGWIAQKTPLSYGWSLTAVIGVLLIAAGLTTWRLQSAIVEQVQQFSEALPQSVSELRRQLEQAGIGGWLPQEMPSVSSVAQQSGALSRLTGLASGALDAIVGVIVVLFVGLYGAAAPQTYQRGIRHLVSKNRRQRADEVLCTLGATLRWWIVGQLISMTIVGTLIGGGLALLGVKMALLLGLIAGLAELVPNLGPVLASVPALLIAWSESSQVALYVAVLFVVVQILDGYLIVPLIQRQAVELPPALVILGVVLMGTVAGIVGALVATPLLAAVMVLVKMLYVEDRLGDRSVHVAGESACT